MASVHESIFVLEPDNTASRTDPAGGRRKLPPAPGNPRQREVGMPCSRAESPPISAQPASTKTGLSRRRSRVRVPSLPPRKSPANRNLLLSPPTPERRFCGPLVAQGEDANFLQIAFSGR